ncbi:MAG: hypothetical protein E7306_07355 [Butyrivibrio sp.]|nr:hypothetical protein [Butyrivibrio sp.]
MIKITKQLLYVTFALAVFLLMPKTAYAEIKTYELNMIDAGNGIMIPENYNNLKVKNENGEYAVLPNPTADMYEPVEIPFDECEYSDLGWHMDMELEGGYHVTKYYLNDITPGCEKVKDPREEPSFIPMTFTKNGFVYYEIYDDTGNFVCSYGFNPVIDVFERVAYVYHIKLGDEDGNCSYTNYGNIDVRQKADYSGEYLEVNPLEKPGAISLKDVEKQVQEVYTSSYFVEQDGTTYQSDIYLNKRTTLKDGEIDKCYVYDYDTPASLEKFGYEPVIGDGSEESYLQETYDCKNLEVWRFHKPIDKSGPKGPWNALQAPYYDLQIATIRYPRYADEPFYALKLQYYFTAEWGEDVYVEDYHYFTKEDYDFLVANNITDGDVIASQYPEMMVKYSEAHYDHDAVINVLNKAMRQHREAIDKIVQVGPEETNDADSASSKESQNDQKAETTQKGTGSNVQYRDGFPVYTQKITGDAVPINGMVPTWCETWIKDGHYLVTLRDDSFNIVKSTELPAGDWYNHAFVYFTMISAMDNNNVIFTIAGTDSAVSGNLNYYQHSDDIETKNGYTGADQYINRDDYTGPLDQYEGQEYLEYQAPTATNGED